jgi:hypothetical protein
MDLFAKFSMPHVTFSLLLYLFASSTQVYVLHVAFTLASYYMNLPHSTNHCMWDAYTLSNNRIRRSLITQRLLDYLHSIMTDYNHIFSTFYLAHSHYELDLSTPNLSSIVNTVYFNSIFYVIYFYAVFKSLFTNNPHPQLFTLILAQVRQKHS